MPSVQPMSVEQENAEETEKKQMGNADCGVRLFRIPNSALESILCYLCYLLFKILVSK